MSETHRWERLAPVEELRTLAEDTAVVVYKNHPAARVVLRPYYDQKKWQHLGGWLDNGAGEYLIDGLAPRTSSDGCHGEHSGEGAAT